MSPIKKRRFVPAWVYIGIDFAVESLMKKSASSHCSVIGSILLVFCSLLVLHASAQYDLQDGISEPMPESTVTAPPVVPITAPEIAKPKIVSPYADLRDPFWPVGFTPDAPAGVKEEKKQQVAEEPKWGDAVKMLDVKGVMNVAGGKYMAMINNQVVKEGDVVSVRMGELPYRWKVHSVSKRGARFEKLDAKR